MADRGRVKLTKKYIDAATYAGSKNSEDVRWDSEVRGFGLRVFPSGTKSFIARYSQNGRRKTFTIGTYGVLELEQKNDDGLEIGARAQAQRILANVKVGGADPAGEKRLDMHGDTVSDLCAAYEARHAPLKKTGDTDKARIKKYIKPAWGTLKARSIRRADVAALHHQIGAAHPYEANRVLALVSVIFAKGREWGLLPENHVNPTRDVQTFKEVKRDRWVKPEELPRLAAAIDTEHNAFVRGVVWAYLLTGARKNELLRARWEHVDFARRELVLPDSKVGKRFIPLSAPAIALLQALPRFAENPYIFCGRVRGESLVNVSKAWNRIRKEAGLEDVRLHDLRRSVGSWLATSGVSLPIIGKTLGHTQPATTAIYARLSEDPARAALEEHGEAVERAAGGRLRLVK